MKLIEDLVPLIIDSTDWSTASSSLALVSQSWLWPARRRLYKHPTITSDIQCRHLVRTLESVPALQSLVYGLHLWLDERPLVWRGRRAVRVVLSLRNLRSISFIPPTATYLIPKILNHALIKDLCIFPENHPLPTPTRWPNNMVKWEPNQVSKFTALTRLVVSDAYLHTAPPSLAAYAQYSPKITHLTLSRCYGQMSDLLDPLAWARLHTVVLILLGNDKPLLAALSHSAASLVWLHLEYDTPPGSTFGHLASWGAHIFDAFCAPGAPQLRSLRSLRLIDVGPHLQALRNIAVRCPGLTHLTISGHLAVHQLCEFWGWPEDVAVAFPALEEMAGPAIVEAPGGILVSSKAYWETRAQGRWTVYAGGECDDTCRLARR